MTKKLNEKSIITCDMEGRIQTFNTAAEKIFGYRADEVVGKKRVSLFSPGLTVLAHVTKWLKTAREQGEFKSTTVFLDHDGQPIAASIRITPTFKNDEQIGYCGVTEVLENVSPESIAPKISPLTKFFSWIVITRAPFLTAIIIPVLIAAAWVTHTQGSEQFPSLNFWLTLVAAICLHIAANTFNDYFDWRSGTDKLNNNYFMPYSGGSRSIELGLISEQSLFRLASTALFISAILGIWITILSGPGIIWLGLTGAFSAYFYTAPPVRLAARRGLGELTVALNFGPLALVGAVYALTGQFSWQALMLGIPVGLLTSAILWINQFPDIESDRVTGKINLVVVLGRARARWGYLLLIAGAVALLVYWVKLGVLPPGAVLALMALPLAIRASIILMWEYEQRSLIRANVATIQLHFTFGILLATGIAFSYELGQWLTV